MNDMSRSMKEEVRAKIDELDQTVHRDLIDRSALIADIFDKRSETSKLSENGHAFQPAWESQIARRLIVRHSGQLPIESLEQIWRAIISASSTMHMPISVALYSGNSERNGLRDLARYYFGFHPQLTECESPEDAISDLANSSDSFALISLKTDHLWWSHLRSNPNHAVLARLPFIEPNRLISAGPAYLIGERTPDFEELDTLVFVVPAAKDLERTLHAIEGRIVHESADWAILEVSAITGQSGLAANLASIGIASSDIRQIGAIAAPIRLLADGGVQPKAAE